jgi:transcriptional regulator with XRE-family HTH domain
MSETTQLLATIKRQLKAQGLMYRDVAAALKLSEPSVKRLFSGQRLTVDRLAQIGKLLGFSLTELLQESAATLPVVHALTETQERQLISDNELLLVAVCAFNHWSLADIISTYRLTPTEGLKRLLVLDRMGVIALMPGDRIRLRVARDFDWLPGGPIRQMFMAQGLADFLDSRFHPDGETLEFAHGMLTTSAMAEFQTELRRVRSRLATLHQDSASAPFHQRVGTGVLLAMREWEPASFAQLRRVKPG